tara:strand:+ start:227 stop:1147 length:921 start_codon:yes stop_codon:yes gene_type:complete
MWIFDFSNLQLNSKTIEKHNYSLTILIHKITDVNLLLKTLDSIQCKSSYEKIKLILFNHTDSSLDKLLEGYKLSFNNLKVLNNYKQSDLFNIEVEKIQTDYIVSIKNGMVFNNNFFNRSILYLSTYNLSLLFFPIQCNNYNKRYIFNQLLHSFKQSFLCSIVNKNIYVLKSVNKVGYFIKNDTFQSILKDDIDKKLDQKFIMDRELAVYYDSQKLDLSRNYIFDIFLLLNTLFFIITVQFISSPNLLLLIIIFIKIFPELYFQYSYYNKLNIRFPKIEFLVYSIFQPIYLFIIWFSNIKIKNNKLI